MKITASRELGKALCEALGLDAKNVHSVTIKVDIDSAVINVVESFVERDAFKRVTEVISQRTWVLADEDDGT